MDEFFPCVVCNLHVRRRQEALQCDSCDRWQHRVNCTPGMTRAEYRELCRMDSSEVLWKCRDCAAAVTSAIDEPLAESTRNASQADVNVINEVSFEIDQASFEEEQEHLEETIADPMPAELDDVTHRPVTFHFIEDGSQKGRGKLVESTGYSYAIKQRKGTSTYWTCSVRNKTMKCPATVIEKDGSYSKGAKEHVHPALPDLFTTTSVTREVKRLAKNQVFTPASEVVHNVIAEKVDIRAPMPSLPPPANLIRTANRARQRMRPAEPTDMNFELAEDFIPTGFQHHDLHVDGFRHLVFYTRDQLNLLESSKTWFMDATFKVVDDPFCQLFSLHAFVKSGSNMKQVPLLFALMSRKRKQDYKEVFQCLRDNMRHFSLKTAVADFEAGMWQGFRAVFPHAKIRGCSFHWSQAVFRRIQKLGLETAYNKQEATRRLLRKVLSLPYLPEAHIEPAFAELQSFATTPALQSLMEYIENTWFRSTVWSVKNWSVFGLAVRTNNDVEGWHRRLNQRATRPKVQLYLLLPLLYNEAELVQLQTRLVSEGKLRRAQRKSFRNLQGKIFRLWESYREKELTASQLLREIAQLNGL